MGCPHDAIEDSHFWAGGSGVSEECWWGKLWCNQGVCGSGCYGPVPALSSTGVTLALGVLVGWATQLVGEGAAVSRVFPCWAVT